MSENRKLRVFLCHASQDKPAAMEIYNRLLVEQWIDPWFDDEKLLPGQDWDLEIEKAVEAADAVIVFLSNNSVTKEGYIQRELRVVLGIADYLPEGNIFVIPLRLEDCPTPHRLKMWHYVDYFPSSQKDNAYRRLVDSLEKKAETISLSKIENVPKKDIRIHINVIDSEGGITTGSWFKTKPDISVFELLENVKRKSVTITDELENYEILLHLPLGNTLKKLILEDGLEELSITLRSKATKSQLSKPILVIRALFNSFPRAIGEMISTLLGRERLSSGSKLILGYFFILILFSIFVFRIPVFENVLKFFFPNP